MTGRCRPVPSGRGCAGRSRRCRPAWRDGGADPADGIASRVGRDGAGNGLRGLAERLAAANGWLEAGRQPDGGFRLAVTVPLPSGRREPG